MPDVCTTLYNWEPDESVHFEVVGSDFSRTKRACTLSLVSKQWYCVAQHLLFNVLSIGDSDNWTRLADRLESPIYSAIGLQSAPSGAFITRIHLVTTDFTDAFQEDALQIIASCVCLRTLHISGHDSTGLGTLLTGESVFVDGFLDAVSPCCNTLLFLSLSLNMDKTAARLVLNSVSHLTELRCLSLYTSVAVGDTQLRQDVRSTTMRHLHSLIVDCSQGGDFPFLRLFCHWRTPALKVLVLSGPGALIGLEQFWRPRISHGKLRSIAVTDVMVEFPAISDDFIFRPHSTMESIMVPWYNVRFEGVFTGVSYVALCGYLSAGTLPIAAFTTRVRDMIALERAMDSLLNRSKFPDVKKIQLLDVSIEEIANSYWRWEDYIFWKGWIRCLELRDVAFVDRIGLPIYIEIARAMEVVH